MKGLSVCNTSLSPQGDKEESIKCFDPKDVFNLKEELDKQFELLKQKQRKEVISAYGIRIAINKALPADSALFINQENKVVAAYANGRIVYLPQREVINPSGRLPTLLKKKRRGIKRN